MERSSSVCALVLILTASLWGNPGQSLGNTGTVEGTVVDPSGAAVPNAAVQLHNPLTGYTQSVTTGPDGAFRLVNVPPNPYHIDITASGFQPFSQEVQVRGSVPVELSPKLTLAGASTSVTVEAGAADMVETVPSAHVDVNRTLIDKLPVVNPGNSLSSAITYSTGAVTADANGFFHPLGDHGEVSYIIDGQPVTDQQSKIFSTQLPTSAVQSMELVTGTPGAEFGDKTSLVAQVTTRSALGTGKLFGGVDAGYGSFGTAAGDVSLGYGTAKWGNFVALDGTRSGRFLDTPEFTPFHAIGNNQSIFDRFDFQPSNNDVLHLNLFAARNWIQIPNDYDQLSQDQRQRVLTWNFAPGYQHTFGSKTLLTIDPYIRKDQFNYFPSNPLTNDFPATQAQQRQLLNWGVRTDVATTTGKHEIKYGMELKQTRLLEDFQFGVTDPAFNSPCLNAAGDPVANPGLSSPGQCSPAGYLPNTANNPAAAAPFAPSLLPFDLSRGGRLFTFHDTGNINQYALYVQDEITLGRFLFTPGFRLDRYDGLVSQTGPQPRLGVAYNVKRTGTVLRAAYARTFETPFNENLLLSSSTGMGGLLDNAFGSTPVPIRPGFRNQFNTGFQQALGKFLLVDAEYFWKYTHNAYDFSTLLNTTITFPISWHNSRLDGVTGRVSTIDLRGFQAYWTFGHTRARFFPLETGGLIPQGAALGEGVFRIDHDQTLQSTTVLRYQHKKQEWIAMTWRYDSGEVVSGVPDAGAALTMLTPNQQVTIGLACNGIYATVANPLSPANCHAGPVTSKLISLPQGGFNGIPSQQNPDHNPARVQPRNVIDLGIGSDNLFHTEHRKITASIDIANLTNKVALYNFLSTFSGTHFLQPRTVVAHIGFSF